MSHNIVSGNYSGTWDNRNLGRTEEGWFLEITHKGEVITLEELGDNMVDLIHRGSEVTIEAVLKEANSEAIENALWPWHQNSGAIECIGQLAVADGFARPLVLTVQTGCRDTSGNLIDPPSPQTLTFHRTIMAPDVASRINFNNKPRLVPIRFNCYLFDVANPTGGNANAPDLRYYSVA